MVYKTNALKEVNALKASVFGSDACCLRSLKVSVLDSVDILM